VQSGINFVVGDEQSCAGALCAGQRRLSVSIGLRQLVGWSPLDNSDDLCLRLRHVSEMGDTLRIIQAEQLLCVVKVAAAMIVLQCAGLSHVQI
jgi:hypothetical protein